MAKRKKVKPTEKQKRFVREKLKGKSSYRAATDAGYSPNTAVNANQDILEKPGTQSVIASLKGEMKKLGFDEKLVARRLNDSMFAEKLNNKGDSYTDWNAVHRSIDKFLSLNEIASETIKNQHDISSLQGTFGEIVQPNEDKSEAK